MSPQSLAGLITNLSAAADVVEAIDDSTLQQSRGWNLRDWSYQLVPWGVCFVYRKRERLHYQVVSGVCMGPS